MTVTSGDTPAVRRGLFAVFAGCLVGSASVVLLSAPAAQAETDPCQASEIAKTIGSVATSMGTYLDENPATNQALTAIAAHHVGPQSLATTKSYFDANPAVAKDMQRLQAPLVKLSSQCQLPVTLPQVLGLMQAAQAPAAGLPAGLQNVGTQAAADAANSVVQGAGPVPGPAAG